MWTKSFVINSSLNYCVYLTLVFFRTLLKWLHISLNAAWVSQHYLQWKGENNGYGVLWLKHIQECTIADWYFLKRIKFSILERIHSEMKEAILNALLLKKIEEGASAMKDITLSQLALEYRKIVWWNKTSKDSFSLTSILTQTIEWFEDMIQQKNIGQNR